MSSTKNTLLSKSAHIVKTALAEKGLNCQVLELSTSTRTANEAAVTIGCEVAQIVKSLIFRTQNTGQPILVLASGINRVNEKLLEKEVQEKITKADANFTREVTGFVIGGIPPVGHKQKLVTYVDEDLLQYDELWAAAGTPFAVFNFPASALVKLTDGKIISIK